ncbi:MAG: TolC family protein, partial [Opitutales bacterium]|nr:TolC family protein [Opitutales bacterium]
SYSAGLDARWEVDVWGGIRNSVKASKANNAALTANYEAAQQSLVAQSMQSWFNLITQGKLLDLAERRRDSLADTERLLTRQYESGTATLAALELARTDAANARADYQSATEDRNQAARALQTLLGQYPDASLIAARSWPALERTVPTGLPSELLLVRPDIVAAYQQILAADARVKVAYADLFPSFTLTASGGRSSDTLSNLGRSGFDVWSLAGQVSAH